MAKIKNPGRPRVGLALSGGVARGIAHIGVLRALLEHNIPIDCISGTSAGAIVAASFAFRVPLEKLEEEARGLRWYSIIKLSTSKFGLVSNQEIEKRMEKLIGRVNIEDAEIPLAIVATDVETGDEVVMRKGKAALAVRASSCVPVLFIPVEMDDMKLIDGQISESLPLSPLGGMKADIVVGVDVNHWHSRKKVGNVLDVISNSIEILSSYKREHASHNADVLIEPAVSRYSASDFKRADDLIAEGYRAAVEKIPEIERLLNVKVKKSKKKTLADRVLGWFK